MAYSRSYTEADGSSTDFVLGFDYLDKSHIKIYINGVLTTAWSWLNDSTIRFNSAPTAGAIVLLKRLTSPQERLVNYISPSSLNEEDLNLDSIQAFYLAQEANDQANAGVADDPTTGQYTAAGKRVTNVADPVDAQDAVTKVWAETALSSQLAQAIAAKDAAIAARNITETNALATAGDRVSTAADRLAVSTDKGIVAADKATVAADKGIVAADKAAVAADKIVVANDRATVSTDKGIVAADKATTQGYRDAAASSASSASGAASTASGAATTATNQASVSVAARDIAVAAAGSAESDAAATAADRLAVAADKGVVAADKTTTEGYKNAAASSASGAAGSASTAATQAGLSSTARSGAETARTGSETARDKAQQWADENEDVPVESGKFSAKHWAAKAAAYVAGVALPPIGPGDVGKTLSVTESGTWGIKSITKTDIDLSEVDNTSDADKPVSVAQAAALALKADASTVREKLDADRTYYVRTDGSDSNTGLANTSGGAFLTANKALEVAATLDFGGFTVTIQLGDGTYTQSVVIPVMVGQSSTSKLIVQGNSASPGNVIVAVTGGDCFSTASGARAWIRDLEVRTTTSGYCLKSLGGGSELQWSNLRFGACAAAHVLGGALGSAVCVGDYAITGGGTQHWIGSHGGVVEAANKVITITGTPAFTASFGSATQGILRAFGNTYNGSATGSRYAAVMNGTIQTFGAGASALPGNVAGTVSTGGQYA